MYDRTITARYLDAQMQADPSFKAEYHSTADIDAMIDLLADAWDPEKKRQLRKFTPDELAFMENERILCALDARYYYTRYVRIVDAETRRLVRFTMNVAQEVVFDVWSEMEAKGWAIMMLQLKARRLGLSTLSTVEIGRRMQFRAETAAIIASSTPEKSTALVKIMGDIWDQMPWWLMPTPTAIVDGVPTEFAEHNASLSIQAGNQFSGMGRGGTPSAVLLSEVCEWRDPYGDIDSSLLKAIIEGPEVFFMLESTALGRDNWYHHKWRISKDGWPNVKLYPMFLPWFVGRDIYPSEGWLLKHPVPGGWIPDDRLIAHAERARAFVKSNPRLRKFIGTDWVMPREQMWWYHVNREEDERNGILNLFLAEVCADDMEAFQSTNVSAFTHEVIQNCRDRVKEPLGVYKLVGVRGSEEDIPQDQRPMSTEIDRDKPCIPIDCVWGRFEGHYQLVPVKFDGFSASPGHGYIFIWEWPKPGYEYAYGCDTAEGIGLDRTGLEMVRKDTLTEPDAQVCEVFSDRIGTLDFWPWCMALGTLYSPTHRGERKQAKSCIEVKFGADALQYELRKRGWSNFLVWPRVLDAKKIDLSRSQKLGFVTNTWSRPIMVDKLLTWINRDRIDINSPYLIDEMSSFEKEEEKQSIRAANGAHDDRLISMGIVIFALHLHEVYSDKVALAERREAQSHQADPEYDPGFQGRDFGMEYSINTFEAHHKLPTKVPRLLP